jgi:hypothetical protein
MNTIAQITLQGDSSFSVPSVEGAAKCGFQIFDECDGVNCSVDCSARIPVYDLTENTRPLGPWDLAFIAFTVVSLLVVFLMPVAADRFNAVQIAMEDQ